MYKKTFFGRFKSFRRKRKYKKIYRKMMRKYGRGSGL